MVQQSALQFRSLSVLSCHRDVPPSLVVLFSFFFLAQRRRTDTGPASIYAAFQTKRVRNLIHAHASTTHAPRPCPQHTHITRLYQWNPSVSPHLPPPLSSHRRFLSSSLCRRREFSRFAMAMLRWRCCVAVCGLWFVVLSEAALRTSFPPLSLSLSRKQPFSDHKQGTHRAMIPTTVMVVAVAKRFPNGKWRQTKNS